MTMKDRLEKLESSKISQELDPKVWVFVNERLDKLEHMNLKRISENTLISRRLSELEQWTRKEEDSVHERLEKMEHYIYGEGDISALIGQVDSLNNNWGHVSHQADRLDKIVNALNERIHEVELLVNAVRDSYNNLCAPSLRKEPYKCPVCCGDGSIPHKVPDEMTADHKGFVMKIVCHSCEGKGIIWG